MLNDSASITCRGSVDLSINFSVQLDSSRNFRLGLCNGWWRAPSECLSECYGPEAGGHYALDLVALRLGVALARLPDRHAGRACDVRPRPL